MQSNNKNKSQSQSQHIIAPSILSADFANLGAEVTSVLAAGANWIHFDVMDNHYVPNLTIGPLVCEAIKPYVGNSLIDVHLMVEPVDSIIPLFANAGADIITFHPEASKHIHRSLSLIKEYGLKCGLVFNPGTPLEYLQHSIHMVDVVLLMSVNPGFGGQSFIPETLHKISLVREILNKHKNNTGKDIILEVDGGVKLDNIAEIAKSGATAFVAGSAIFGKGKDYAQIISQMRKNLESI
jgi:ribulose-phosphate 3-epimerase